MVYRSIKGLGPHPLVPLATAEVITALLMEIITESRSRGPASHRGQGKNKNSPLGEVDGVSVPKERGPGMVVQLMRLDTRVNAVALNHGCPGMATPSCATRPRLTGGR